MNILSAQGRISRGPFIWLSLLPLVIIAIMLLFHGGLSYYIYKERFEIKEVTLEDSTATDSAEATASSMSHPPAISVTQSVETPDSQGVITTFKADAPDAPGQGLWFGIVAVICLAGLLVTWIVFASEIKRLHDIGQTGLFVLLNFVPGAGFFMWLFLAFAKGQSGANKYGSDPKAK